MPPYALVLSWQSMKSFVCAKESSPRSRRTEAVRRAPLSSSGLAQQLFTASSRSMNVSGPELMARTVGERQAERKDGSASVRGGISVWDFHEPKDA